MYSKLFLILLIFYSCNIDDNEVTRYVPEPQIQDESISELKLKNIDTISIQENDDVIIQFVQSFSVSQDGKFYALTVPASKQLVVYDNNGNIIQTHNAWTNLSDSVVASGKKTLNYFWDPKMSHFTWHFIEIEELRQFSDELNDTMRINNMFITPQFIENMIYCNALVYIPSLNGTKDNRISYENRSVILKFTDDFENYQCYVADHPFHGCTMSDDFEIADNLILTVSDFTRPRYYDKYDSLMTICEYNKASGEVIGIIGYLPKCYETSKIAYELYWQPMLHERDGGLYVAYPLDKYIYERHNKIRFELKNLPFSNEPGFQLYTKYKEICEKLIKIPENEVKKAKYLHNMFPMRTLKLFGDEENLIVCILVKVPGTPPYLLIQKYDYDGKLMSQGTIVYDENNVIYQFDYNETNKELVFIKKSIQGWTVERVGL